MDGDAVGGTDGLHELFLLPSVVYILETDLHISLSLADNYYYFSANF